YFLNTRSSGRIFIVFRFASPQKFQVVVGKLIIALQPSIEYSMIGNSPRSQDFLLRRIITQIVNAREQHTTYILINGTDEVEPKPDTHFWFTLFQHAFLISQSHDACVNGPRDDLLFFVNKKTTGSSKVSYMLSMKLLASCASFLYVYDNTAKTNGNAQNQSEGAQRRRYIDRLGGNRVSKFIDAILCLRCYCGRLHSDRPVGVGDFEEVFRVCLPPIVKNKSDFACLSFQTVYASPNRRRMDSKGNREEVVYPNLFFSLENYDEIFTNCVLRDGECLCVELTAYDLNGCLQGVCFLGTIDYTSLKSFHDSKSRPFPPRDNVGFLGRHFGSVTNNTYSSSRQSAQQSRVKFLQVLGPHSVGLIELAISVVDEFPECHCGRSAGFDLLSRCCSCRTAGPADRHLSDVSPSNRVIDSKAVTEQPEKSTVHPDDQWLTDRMFSDWVDLSVDYVRGDLSRVTSNSIEPLHFVPWFAKSAGASTSTSPVRHWRRSSVASRLFLGASDVGENTSAYRPSWTRANQLRTKRDYGRRDSRVSDILGQFIHLDGNCGPQSGHPRQSSELHSDEVERTAVANAKVRTGVKTDAEKVSENTTSPVVENNVLSQGCVRNRKSLGQSWAWFKERRRIASVGLNTALTFLSLPCHDILSGKLNHQSIRLPILCYASYPIALFFAT
ncbi:uncharacterized protein DEA37_0005999, partial [Paragonimus westermani]